MALKIRLSRGGAKKRPYYRVVVADSRKARDGRFIERIGSYNPMVPKDHPDRFKLDEDRAKHWMSVGATPSDRVAHLMNKLGLADKPVVHEQTKQHLPRPKTLERMKEREEKAAAAAEAPAEEAAPEEAPAEEAAAEEAPAEEAAAEEAPAEEAAAEEAPAEEAAAEEAPAEEAPGNEEKKEEG